MKVYPIVVLSVLCGFLTACQSTNSSSARPVEMDRVDTNLVSAVTWKLIHWGDDKQLPDDGEKPITLIIQANGEVSGFSGVNRYAGNLQIGLDGSVFWSGPIISTKMAGAEKAMQRENNFLRDLASVSKIKTKDGQLLLLGPGGMDMTLWPK